MYYIYILRCSDNSLYTGITTDISRRIKEHTQKNQKGAKYTKSHEVISLEALWSTFKKSNALKLEYRIKRLTKPQKEKLILNEDYFLELISDIDAQFVRIPIDKEKNLP